MFELKNNGIIRVSQGDTFVLNVISAVPFKKGDIATLTIKEDLDSTDTVIEKVETELHNCWIRGKNDCCCNDNDSPFSDGNKCGLATFEFSSLDTCKEPGTYYYDIQFDYESENNVRYTAMWPTKFIIVEDVTNNVFEMTDIEMPGIITPPEEGDDTNDEETQE